MLAVFTGLGILAESYLYGRL